MDPATLALLLKISEPLLSGLAQWFLENGEHEKAKTLLESRDLLHSEAIANTGQEWAAGSAKAEAEGHPV